MNAWQVAKQLRYRFRAAVWPDVGGQAIWGTRVHVTNSMAQAEYANLGSPAILIAVNDDTQDEQSAGYVKQIFTVTYWCSVPGDMRGEGALIGTGRTSGSTTSSGRGILEFAEEVARILREMQETVGVKIIAKRKSDVGTGIIEGLGYVAIRQSVFEAKCTDARYYHPPLRVRIVTNCGAASLSWSDPPDRFDGVGRTIRIRRAAGSTPPQLVTDGVQVIDIARNTGFYVDVPGAGTWSYTFFAGYSDSAAAVNERYSEGPATEEGVSVTGVV